MGTTSPVAKTANATKTPTNDPSAGSAERLTTLVTNTADLSEETIQAMEDAARAAIEAVGKFVVTVEDALPQEVQGTSDVAKKVTESGLEMADRLVHTQSDFLRRVVAGAGDSLAGRDAGRSTAAK